MNADARFANPDHPVVPAHQPRTEAQRRADTSGRPHRWRGRVVYPAHQPGLTSQ